MYRVINETDGAVLRSDGKVMGFHCKFNPDTVEPVEFGSHKEASIEAARWQSQRSSTPINPRVFDTDEPEEASSELKFAEWIRENFKIVNGKWVDRVIAGRGEQTTKELWSIYLSESEAQGSTVEKSVSPVS